MSNLNQVDIKRAADKLGVEPAKVWAVTEVESNGYGMLPSGKPKILFERHVFRKELAKRGIKTDGLPESICSVKTGGYQGGEAEYNRLDRAAKIEREAALSSCSWGLFQIMGYHWKALKYASLQEFVNAMYSGEAGQLDAFVRFIQANPQLDKALKSGDWTAFAKGYNGAGYKANRYDEKLKAAYDKHASK
ncbi:endolysin [Yersinia phage vB_YenS_P400]|nr:endolysin [Yersinia phage vB_YenS_P400]